MIHLISTIFRGYSGDDELTIKQLEKASPFKNDVVLKSYVIDNSKIIEGERIEE